MVTRLKFILVVFEMVTLGEHTFNQGADPVVKIGFRNVATDTWVTVDNDTVTLQVLYKFYYYTQYTTTPSTTSFTFKGFQKVSMAYRLRVGILGVESESHGK